MPPPIPIPTDVRQWLRGAFRSCNEQVSGIVSQVPTTHEPALDMAFIQHFAGMAAPFRLPSDWLVRVQTHFLGGGRHFADLPHLPPRWEIADIGVLVQFRQDGRTLRSKVALLQSKRLYPDELDWDEDSPLDYIAGFGRLYEPDDAWSVITAPRPFTFTTDSRYKALVSSVRQYTAIAQYEERHSIPVYYLLYNPRRLPHTVVFPIAVGQELGGACHVGCRVVPAQHLRVVLADEPPGYSPSYANLTSGIVPPLAPDQYQAGWPLEQFMDLVLDCEAGYIANTPNDSGLNYIFTRRTGPIAAAISFTIEAPPN